MNPYKLMWHRMIFGLLYLHDMKCINARALLHAWVHVCVCMCSSSFRIIYQTHGMYFKYKRERNITLNLYATVNLDARGSRYRCMPTKIWCYSVVYRVVIKTVWPHVTLQKVTSARHNYTIQGNIMFSAVISSSFKARNLCLIQSYNNPWWVNMKYMKFAKTLFHKFSIK